MTEQKPLTNMSVRVTEEIARKVRVVAALDGISIQDIGGAALVEYLAKREAREPIPA